MKPINLEEAITNLQLYLRTISFFDERIERVPIDGIYESSTKNAVAQFQQTRSLPQTSIVDKRTWDAIYEEYANILRNTDELPPPKIFPSSEYGYSVGRGEESSFVAILQLMLRELGVLFDFIPDIAVDGIYGEETENAIRLFQEASLLSPTGRVDLNTYNRLNSAFLSRGLY